ncbi:hypothetical protein [Sphingosinicella sp.]|uniref:hypothetical protein n=1 Tax=Sphingosinicella sp. TaxID=1917971 RepID=UPI00262612A6|nr:hypothetical protein [Sphingosinicella sp.]
MSPAIHTPATLLDAYEAGRMTRPELLDHLLEWRKAVSVKTEHMMIVPSSGLLRVVDELAAPRHLCTALAMMASDLEDADQVSAFTRVAEAVKAQIVAVEDRIDAIRLGRAQ